MNAGVDVATGGPVRINKGPHIMAQILDDKQGVHTIFHQLFKMVPVPYIDIKNNHA